MPPTTRSAPVVLESPFRRPETTAEGAFWRITVDAWNEHVTDSRSQDKKVKEKGLNALRKFDACGRIMETAEGRSVEYPCAWCARGGSLGQAECRVFIDTAVHKACAYCKRNGRKGCNALAEPAAEEEEEEAANAADTTAIAARLEEVETVCEAQADRIEELESQVAALQKQLGEVYDTRRSQGKLINRTAKSAEKHELLLAQIMQELLEMKGAAPPAAAGEASAPELPALAASALAESALSESGDAESGVTESAEDLASGGLPDE